MKGVSHVSEGLSQVKMGNYVCAEAKMDHKLICKK